MKKPWPGMLRGIWGDDARYKEQYWSKVPHMYLAGDNARRDKDGYYWIMGRIDDVLNVAGHRLSTIEIESALVSHPAVAEAAAVGRPHELKGDAVAVFVVLKTGQAGETLATSSSSTSARKSARWLSPTMSALPPRFPKRAAAKSCAVYCETSQPAKNPPATPAHWKIIQSSPNSATTKNNLFAQGILIVAGAMRTAQRGHEIQTRLGHRCRATASAIPAAAKAAIVAEAGSGTMSNRTKLTFTCPIGDRAPNGK